VSLAPAALDPEGRRLTVLAVCVGQGMILLDNTIVNVALPAIQCGLRMTQQERSLAPDDGPRPASRSAWS
jgi:hypothetical protein